MTQKRILLYYKYVTLPQPEAIRAWQQELCLSLNLTGRIVLATEGINGTVCGTLEQTNAYIAAMNAHEFFGGIDFKDSIVDGQHEYFPGLQIKVKPEITHLGLDTTTITAADAGTHLTPAAFHEAIKNANANTVILDGRNVYEAAVGAFTNAVVPPIDHFRDFPAYVDENLALFKDKEVLMYCTGGIRCEKASAWMLHNGFTQVHHLEGGILHYVRQVRQLGLENRFIGKNFVFDERMGERITDDVLAHCHTCGQPCDTHANCANPDCHQLIIQCPDCARTLAGCCSIACRDLR